MEKIKLTNKIKSEICQRKFNQETTEKLYDEYRDIYHVQRSDINRLYHNYLEILELQLIQKVTNESLKYDIKYAETQKAFFSQWILYNDDIFPRHYYKTFHHHFSAFLIKKKVYTIYYLQQILNEYTQLMFTLKKECIAMRSLPKSPNSQSQYNIIMKDYHPPRNGNELKIFKDSQNSDVDKKTILNYLKLIGYDFSKKDTYIYIATNDRSNIRLYITNNMCFTYLFSSNQCHFMIFDSIDVNNHEHCVKFISSLNILYNTHYYIIK